MTQFNEDLMKALARFLGPYDNNISSGNNRIDEILKASQRNSIDDDDFLEWIEFNKLVNFKYISRGGIGEIYSAIWKDGPSNSADIFDRLFNRKGECFIVVKFFKKDKEFFNEIIGTCPRASGLANDILNGRRPGFNRDLMPHCYESLMRNCWSNGKRNRPKAETLYARFCEWEENYYKRNSPFKNFRLQRVEPSGNGNGYF
ncbi:18425_t:CDS:2 [Rhizophagus irregularis]|nr:18425_t:CDS:2 [Rhizophagus irregularis]